MAAAVALPCHPDLVRLAGSARLRSCCCGQARLRSGPCRSLAALAHGRLYWRLTGHRGGGRAVTMGGRVLRRIVPRRPACRLAHNDLATSLCSPLRACTVTGPQRTHSTTSPGAGACDHSTTQPHDSG